MKNPEDLLQGFSSIMLRLFKNGKVTFVLCLQPKW